MTRAIRTIPPRRARCTGPLLRRSSSCCRLLSRPVHSQSLLRRINSSSGDFFYVMCLRLLLSFPVRVRSPSRRAEAASAPERPRVRPVSTPGRTSRRRSRSLRSSVVVLSAPLRINFVAASPSRKELDRLEPGRHPSRRSGPVHRARRGGDVAFWSLLVLYVMCLAVPTVLLLRLPRSLKVPADDSGTEFDRHLDELKQRLRRNDHVSAQPLDTRADIEAALKVLGDRADEVIQQTAGQVFITTAVSQNGSLDSVVVLAAQSKMTWTLARLYYQRPRLRELTYLYGNLVAATAFVAAEIEDLDLAGQLEPVMSSVLWILCGCRPRASGRQRRRRELDIQRICQRVHDSSGRPDRQAVLRSLGASRPASREEVGNSWGSAHARWRRG